MSYIDKDTEKVTSTTTRKEIYNISFKDKMLVHTIIKDESDEVDDSQFYLIKEVELKDGSYVFAAKSGVSGKTYNYVLMMNEDETGTLYMLDEDGGYYRFNGTLSAMKTFKQE